MADVDPRIKEIADAIAAGTLSAAEGALRIVALAPRGIEAGTNDGIAQSGDHAVAVQVIGSSPSGDPRARYLRELQRELLGLPLATLGRDAGPHESLTLDKVYVDLETTTEIEEDDVTDSARGSHHRQLTALEVAVDASRLVLLGGAGSGKSSFVRRLCARLAAAHLGQETEPHGFAQLLPVYVTLRQLAAELVPLGFDLEQPRTAEQQAALCACLDAHLRAQAQRLNASAFGDHLVDAVHDGRVLLVFDGMDEATAAGQAYMGALLQALQSKSPPPQRMIVTCRIRSFGGLRGLEGWVVHELADLDRPRIVQFVQAWYGSQGLTDATERSDDLAAAVRSERLLELARTPMLLTVIAIVHQKGRVLPPERVLLFDEMVKIMIERWHRETGRQVADGLRPWLAQPSAARELLESIATRAHRQTDGAGAADLARGELLTMLEKPMGALELAGAWLDFVDLHAGVFVGHGGHDGGKPASYAFAHRLLQEYLAGCDLVRRHETRLAAEIIKRAAEGPHWMLPVQLAAEEMLHGQRRKDALVRLIAQLTPVQRQGLPERRARVWAARMAAQLGVEPIEASDEPGARGLLPKLRRQLVAVLGKPTDRTSPLPAGERAEAGRCLAKLGDPRSEVLDPLAMKLVPVPQGEGRGYDFHIGRYLVTQAQFAVFVKAGGYREARYWQEARAHGLWAEAGFTDWSGKSRQAPAQLAEPFGLDNHPVVRVSWYEALAFCRWLTDAWRAKGQIQEDQAFALPSELEWHWAAARDQRAYPWGEQNDPDRANGTDTGIRTPAPWAASLAARRGSVVMTWPAMSGNGRAACGPNRRKTDRATNVRISGRRRRLSVCCGAVRFTIVLTACAAPRASGSTRTSRPAAWGFGWCCPHSLCPLDPLHSDPLRVEFVFDGVEHKLDAGSDRPTRAAQ